MQVKCIRAHGLNKPGDVVDGVPDGAAVDPQYWEVPGARAVPPGETSGGAPAPDDETLPGPGRVPAPAAFPPGASEEK